MNEPLSISTTVCDVTIPLHISVSLGQPTVGPFVINPQPVQPATVERVSRQEGLESAPDQFDGRFSLDSLKSSQFEWPAALSLALATSGLISDSYHIKVTVRDQDAFWLSSGNWKMGSSQPPITQEQRDNAANQDLPGNREWHVVVRNKTLSDRLRSHILQDFKQSENLGGRPVPTRLAEETLIDVPVQESVVLERRAPSRILEPQKISRQVKVQPLLTPDQEGAVFSEAVLKLIRSARRSLLFQIPYIGMPSNPEEDRGYIDELIGALVKKLKSLPDARVILRTGGQKLSSPPYAAWYFKSQGVDFDQRLRVIDNHHTKGMIIDGRRVLIGSHNWSKPGVTLNRDASLIFHDEEVACYYAQAFEIDWERANKIRPRQFVRNESVVLEATGATPPAGYQRVRLSEWLTDD